MRPCTRVGLDVTWRCNWDCRHCFYLRNPKFHSNADVEMEKIVRKVDRAAAGGLNHAVLVGYGEPTLAPHVDSVLEYCHNRGMATSIITNGSLKLDRFKRLFAIGLDHLHISSHGLGDTLDEIVGRKGAFQKQAVLKRWLAAEGLPFRTNVTLQQLNYTELAYLAEYETDHRVHHFVLLGFLPHYEWHKHVTEIAVHPAELRPFIEDACRVLIKRKTLFTIRYHPFCHLSPEFWKYVVNARYVAFDPWEWNYDLQVHDLGRLWNYSVGTGEGVAIKTPPCSKCAAYRHCGGWNRTYAAAFGGADLTPITEPPAEYRDVWEIDGGLHDMNPANQCSGTIQRERS